MTHLRTISRRPAPAQGGLDLVESVILLVFTVAFQGWDNFSSVIRNLQKYYSKT